MRRPILFVKIADDYAPRTCRVYYLVVAYVYGDMVDTASAAFGCEENQIAGPEAAPLDAPAEIGLLARRARELYAGRLYEYRACES